MSNGGLQEGDSTLFALIGQYLHERDPRSIVDADMDELPTDAVVTVDGARISSGDAVPDGANPAELFDIEMDELARMLAFIAPDRFGRLQGTELVQAEPTQNTADGGGRDTGLGGDLLASPPLAAQPLDLLDHGLGVGCRSRCGREERSCNPANPSRRYRSTHFRTVRGQTPAASATASGVCPLSTCRTIRSRPRGVSRAFLCTFIRSSRESLKPRNSSFLGQDRVDNLMKAHSQPFKYAYKSVAGILVKAILSQRRQE